MSSKQLEESCKKLVAVGFTKSKATKALKECKNNFAQAKALLQSQKDAEERKIKEAERIKERERKELEEAENRAKKAAELAARGESMDDEKAASDKRRRKKLHPCIAQYGACRYGANCLFKEFPAEVCLQYCLGTCLYGDLCHRSHLIEGMDARKFMGTAVDRTEYVVDPASASEDARADPTKDLVMYELNERGEVANRIVIEHTVERPEAVKPEPSQFNPSRQSAPSYSDPTVASADDGIWSVEAGGESDGSGPTPFLDRLKLPGSERSGKGAGSGNVVQSREYAEASGEVAEAVPNHPCVVQCGRCRFGRNCNHFHVPGDVCVHWLNGRCIHGASCRWKHAYDGSEVKDNILKRPAKNDALAAPHFEPPAPSDSSFHQPTMIQLKANVANFHHHHHQHHQQQQPMPNVNSANAFPLIPPETDADGATLHQQQSGYSSPVAPTAASPGSAATSESIWDGKLGASDADWARLTSPSTNGASAGVSPSLVPYSTTTHSKPREKRGGGGFSLAVKSTAGRSRVDEGACAARKQQQYDDAEMSAFTALREAFPQFPPDSLIIALRHCGNDRKKVAEWILESKDGSLDGQLAAVEAAAEEEKLSAQEAKTVSLLTLCDIFPTVEPTTLQAQLDIHKNDFGAAIHAITCLQEHLVSSDTKNQWNKASTDVETPQNQMKIDRLVGMFPSVDRQLVGQAFQVAKQKMPEAIQVLNQVATDEKEMEEREALGRKATTASLQATDTTAVVVADVLTDDDDCSESTPSASTSGPAQLLSSTQLYHETLGTGRVKKNDEIDWRRLRQEAYCKGSARHQMMSLAIAAYARSDHQTGRSLMLRSLQLKQDYERLNMMAMHALEREQDAANGVAILDLHGFHADEAIDVVDRRVRLCITKRIAQLRVVCGSGRHSKQGRPVVYPAVVEHLKQLQEQGVATIASLKQAEITIEIMTRR